MEENKSNTSIQLGGLEAFKDNLLDINHLIMLGCEIHLITGLALEGLNNMTFLILFLV